MLAPNRGAEGAVASPIAMLTFAVGAQHLDIAMLTDFQLAYGAVLGNLIVNALGRMALLTGLLPHAVFTETGISPNRPAQSLQQGIVKGGVPPEAADKGTGHALAVMLCRHVGPVGVLQLLAPGGLRDINVPVAHGCHGLHVPDFVQVRVQGVQLELLLFHFQTLPFQLKVRQGGVKA